MNFTSKLVVDEEFSEVVLKKLGRYTKTRPILINV